MADDPNMNQGQMERPQEGGMQPGEGAAKLEQMIMSIADGMGTVQSVLEQGENVNPQGLEMISQAMQMFQEGVMAAIGQTPQQAPQDQAVPMQAPEGVPVV